MILEWLLAEVLPFGIVSACCFLSTLSAGLIVSVARRRRPDLRRIVAYAALSPLTIPVLGGYAVALTLLPAAPLLLVVGLVLQTSVGAFAQSYVVFGTYFFGLAIQTVWLSKREIPWDRRSNVNR